MATNAKYIISLQDKFSKKMGTANKSVKTFEKSIIKTSKIVDRFGKPFESVGTKIESVSKKGNKFNKTIGSIGKKIAVVLGGAVAIRSIVRLGDEIVKTTAKFEGFENAITFLSGGAAEGARSMAFLEKNSNDLGISLQASIEGFQTLAGGFKGTGTKLSEIKDIFQKTSVAASAMNLSGERTKLVLLALGQMASKGVVSMEELRRQLGDSLPGAAGIGARAMGMTTQAFNKLVESGQLLSTEFLPRFATELEKTFVGGLSKSTKSVRANLNRLTNSFLKLKVNIGKKFNPEIKGAIKLMNSLVGTVDDWVKTPFADTLRKQQVGLNALVLQLQDTTVSEEDRLKIIKRINSEYPSLLKNINLEKASNEDLATAMQGVNMKFAERIALANLEADLAKQREKSDKIQEKSLNKRATLLQKLAELQIDIEQLARTGTFEVDIDLLTATEDNIEKINILSGLYEDLISQGAQIPGGIRQNLDILQQNIELLDKDLEKEKSITQQIEERVKAARKLLGLPEEGIGINVKGLGAVEDQVTRITSAAPKVFNINIDKFVENLSVNSETVTEGAVQVKNIIKEELIRMLADLQAVGG